MRNLKILMALTLAIAMIFTGCKSNLSASSQPSEPRGEIAGLENEQSEERSLSIACSATDSFCPYTAVTKINRDMAGLLYDSLVLIDDSFKPTYSLAEKIELEGSEATVTIKTALFSDGSVITAEDVVYCANKAMKSSTKYGEGLKDVASVAAAGSNTVVFKLKKADPYFKNQLDFPIYKKNSDEKLSSDNLSIPPIGSGIYVISKDKSELKINNNYHEKKPKVKKIKLINTPDADALGHNLEVGNITCYYSDLATCSLPQVRGGYQKVNINNLVFLGANMKSGLMSYTDMRKAVSAAIDREDITSSAYYGNALPAEGIFNPEWVERKSHIAANENTVNENVYLALLEKIGYNKKDNSGYYVNSEGERLTLTLIYYEGNAWRSAAAELIKVNLRSAGIKLQSKKLSWDDYMEYLKGGYFDLYLGEVKLGSNMDISELVKKGGSAAYGIDYKKRKTVPAADEATSSTASSNTSSEGEEKPKEREFAGETAEALDKFYAGDAEISEVALAFSSEMPIIPICYRTGIFCYTTALSGANPSASNVYCGIGNTQEKQ